MFATEYLNHNLVVAKNQVRCHNNSAKILPATLKNFQSSIHKVETCTHFGDALSRTSIQMVVTSTVNYVYEGGCVE